jgi:hypothetical protein
MIAYGLEFPDNTWEAAIHLYCYRYWDKDNPDMLEKHVHFGNAIKIALPEDLGNGRKGYVWSKWSDDRIKAWCYNEFQTWWGPSSSGKSTDAGLFCLFHWMSAPDRTTVMVCSTTKDMLDRRIWREIVRYHSLLKKLHGEKKIPGTRSRQPPTITLDDPNSAEGENTINAMFAIAIQRGTVEEAVGNIVGVHNDYNVLIIDEMQATRKAAVEAFDNLSTGREAKFLGMGNPVSRLDSLGQYSEPTKGWNSISTDDESWETKKGRCYYFDGLKSPGVDNPEKFHFLLTRKQIDTMAIDPGSDSPRFWSQRRGFVPPEGLTMRVFTENYANKFDIKKRATWKTKPVFAISLDPAFSTGGDRAVLTPMKIGVFDNDMTGIELQKQIPVNLELSHSQPLVYTLADSVIKHLILLGLTPNELSLDTTGAQRALADIIDKEWNVTKFKRNPMNSTGWDKCFRVGFAGSASNKPISTEDTTSACDAYRNRVTELWYIVREFARNNQLRGMGDEAFEQFCSREVLDDGREKISVETKKAMKNRTGGKSPDHADSIAVGVEYVRVKLGIIPGTGDPYVGKIMDEASARLFDFESSVEDDMYLTDDMSAVVDEDYELY